MTDTLLTEATRLRRERHKGVYDRETIYRILDDNPFCTIAFIDEHGRPMAIPSMQWRVDDSVFWHGSTKSRSAKPEAGIDVCLTVARVDGLVLARSAFEHTVNFESVAVVGRADAVRDPDRKMELLEHFFHRLYPGRWDALRPMSSFELKATAVMGLPIEAASAKIRTGPSDEPLEDRGFPVWGGVLPIVTQFASAVPDENNRSVTPDYLLHRSYFSR